MESPLLEKYDNSSSSATWATQMIAAKETIVTYNQKRTTGTGSLKLIPHVMDDWQRAMLELARIKGLHKDLSPHDKIKLILKQELKNVRQLWEAFTVERSQMPRYLLDPKKQSVAYLYGFHLPNFARFQAMLERLQERLAWEKLLSRFEQVRVMDWGCGTGALSHCWSLFLKKYQIEDEQLNWSLIDQHGAFLDTTKLLLHYQRPKLKIDSSKGRLENLIQRSLPKTGESEHTASTLQVLLLGYVWNELKDNPRAKRRVEEALVRLSELPTLIFLLEPGNQFPAREAMGLRDFLVENQWSPLYPCPKASLCPMLDAGRDWCFSEFSWERPALVRQIDERLGINHGKLSSSCYSFASPSALKLLEEASYSAPGHVVVGRPQLRSPAVGQTAKSRGAGFEYLICTGDSLEKKKPAREAELLLRGAPLPTVTASKTGAEAKARPVRK